LHTGLLPTFPNLQMSSQRGSPIKWFCLWLLPRLGHQEFVHTIVFPLWWQNCNNREEDWSGGSSEELSQLSARRQL
jgi:hypothetical protein